MGNTVSAAEAVASGLVHPIAEPFVPPPKHKATGVPPPECPMHQKVAKPAKPAATECPMGHTADDINPYNMVNG